MELFKRHTHIPKPLHHSLTLFRTHDFRVLEWIEGWGRLVPKSLKTLYILQQAASRPYHSLHRASPPHNSISSVIRLPCPLNTPSDASLSDRRGEPSCLLGQAHYYFLTLGNSAAVCLGQPHLVVTFVTILHILHVYIETSIPTHFRSSR